MVNHLMKKPIHRPKQEQKVRVRNLTGIQQGWGIYVLPADPDEWTPVPKSLAKVLAEQPANYEIWSNRIKRLSAASRFKPENVDWPKRKIKNWPSVRIVIPVFNSPDLLAKCLDSLKMTKYKGGLAITLVDNASTDPETLKLVKAHPKLSTIRFDQPQGFSTAVNAGMKQWKADFYVLFNQDCEIIDPDWLTNMIRWMLKRSQCAVAGPKLVYPFKKGEAPRLQHAGIVIPQGATGTHRYLNAPADSPQVGMFERMQAVTGAVFMIRASVIEQIGYFDEGYKFGCEDIEFCLRATALGGHEVWYVPIATVVHHDHGIRRSNEKQSGRINEWTNQSSRLFRARWGTFIDRCATQSVAFVLPDYNPVSGGSRVIAALANRFIVAGFRTSIYTATNALPEDPDIPRLFDIKHLSMLDKADILIATRFDTVRMTKGVSASKRYYLVQQIETAMAKYCGKTEEDVLWSYGQTDYEIITIGEHLAKQLRDLGRSSTVLDVGLYVDLYPFRPHERGEKLRVLMYGSPADYKGAEDNALIARALRERFGGGVEINTFHKSEPAPTWADNHFRPQKTSDVAKLYSDHDAYVYASLSDGFAMTPIEAMACGTPVVLTDFPGKDQYARHGENCLVADFRDVAGVVDLVATIEKDPHHLADSLRKCGRETAEYYDWSRVASQYAQTILGAPKA